MAINHLSDTFIKNLKFQGQKKYHDGGGLYIFITPNNSKLWRMKYHFNGKEKLLSFGEYPIVSLSEARQKRDEAKKLIHNNIDPAEEKKREDKQQESLFGVVAQEWLDECTPKWSYKTKEKYLGYLNNDIL